MVYTRNLVHFKNIETAPHYFTKKKDNILISVQSPDNASTSLFIL